MKMVNVISVLFLWFVLAVNGAMLYMLRLMRKPRGYFIIYLFSRLRTLFYGGNLLNLVVSTVPYVFILKNQRK